LLFLAPPRVTPNSKRGECLNYSYVPENGPDSRRTEFIEMGQ
jgi:hypothetical protein